MQTPNEPKTSKTALKKASKQLKIEGKTLLSFSTKQLQNIDIPKELYDAIQFAKTIKPSEAFNRQIQFITKLMREHDCTDLIDSIKQSEQSRIDIANYWRNTLITSPTKLNALLEEHSIENKQQLRQLILKIQKISIEDPQYNIISKKIFHTILNALNSSSSNG